jgi:flavin-dependent dehydrogenase
MHKCGAEFVSPWHGRGETFEFKDAYDPRPAYAYQVRRSQFDEILIRRASRAGAAVIEGCRVRTADLASGTPFVRVDAVHEDGRPEAWNARFLIDASGRDTFLAGQLGAKRRTRKHNSAAMYAHFSGAHRYRDQRAGNISIYWFEHGWLWFIPLADGASSVGAVVWPAYMKERRSPLGVLPRHRCEVRAAGRTPDQAQPPRRSRPPATTPTPPITAMASATCWRRLRIHRSGVFSRRLAGDEQRRRRR